VDDTNTVQVVDLEGRVLKSFVISPPPLEMEKCPPKCFPDGAVVYRSSISNLSVEQFDNPVSSTFGLLTLNADVMEMSHYLCGHSEAVHTLSLFHEPPIFHVCHLHLCCVFLCAIEMLSLSHFIFFFLFLSFFF